MGKQNKVLVFCEKVGISPEKLEANNLDGLPRELFTNELVLELYRYCSLKRFSHKTICVKWVNLLTPISQRHSQMENELYLKQLYEAIVKLHKTNVDLGHKKKIDEMKDLKNLEFSLPILPCPVESDVQNENMITNVLANEDHNAPESDSESNTMVTNDVDNTLENIIVPRVSEVHIAPKPMKRSSVNSSDINKDDVYATNTLNNTIKRKRLQLQRLESEIKIAKSKLCVLKYKVGRYSIKNVHRRENCMRNALKQTKSEMQLVKAKNLGLTLAASTLEDMIFDSDDKARNEQKMKSYHKQKLVNEELNLKSEVKDLKVELACAESQICTEPVEPIVLPLPMKNSDGSFACHVRECVLELITNEVAADKVAPTMKSVAKHIFNYTLEDVPQRQCVQNIVDEGQLMYLQYAKERLTNTSHYGIRRDGSTRQKVKIMTTAATLDTGEVVPFGFRRVANETAEVIKDTCIQQLTFSNGEIASWRSVGPRPQQIPFIIFIAWLMFC